MQGCDASKVEMTGPSGDVMYDKPARFLFKIPEDAGQGPLNVSCNAESAPKPIKVRDDGIGKMIVEFTPKCVGTHTFNFTWGPTDHIAGSPVTIDVKGEVKRNPQKVVVQGPGLDGSVAGEVGQHVTYTVNAPEDAGPGPLEVDCSGPAAPEVDLTKGSSKGQFTITLDVTKPGKYKLSVGWGSIDNHVKGSPFTIQFVGDAKAGGGSGGTMDTWEPY